MTSPRNTTLCPSTHRSCPDTCLVCLQVKAGVTPLGPSCTHPQLGVRGLESRDTGPAAASPCAPCSPCPQEAPYLFPPAWFRGSSSHASPRPAVSEAAWPWLPGGSSRRRLAWPPSSPASLVSVGSAPPCTALHSGSAGRAGAARGPAGLLANCLSLWREPAAASGPCSAGPAQGHSAGLGRPQAQAVCCSLI